MALNRDQLIAELMKHPNIEVGTAEGSVVAVEESTYDDEAGVHPYINLDIEDE
jgi:hypothetical protein